MSDFLDLNGITVPCSVSAGAKSQIDEIGTSKRAVDGTMLIHRRVTKEKWTFSLTPQDDAHARAFRSLVLGKGEYWPFDATLYGSKGKAPTLATASVFSAGSSYIGAGKLSQTASTGVFDVTLPEIVSSGQWTVMYARKVGSGSWNHYIATFDGSSRVDYTNGAVGLSQSWLAVTLSTGLVALTADSSSTTLVDELVVLPYLVPSDWPAQMYALNNGGTQWSALARVNATGTAVAGNTRTVATKGTANELTYVPSTLAGASFAENNATFAFMLEEV